MSAYGSSHHPAHVKSPISVAWVLALSLLVGVGLFMLAYWFLTGSWLFFLGIAPVVAGGLMMFSPRAGADHA
jgi:hypothetical protein